MVVLLIDFAGDGAGWPFPECSTGQLKKRHRQRRNGAAKDAKKDAKEKRLSEERRAAGA